MLDGFARSITYLRISITDRCNYRCRYCMPDGGIEKCAHEDICSLEELRDMAAAAVRCGVKKIRVTGGEPLVRRGAVDFCRMLSEISGVEELCVTTNSSLLKEVARPLRDAGVTHLNISLDTLNEERFRAITLGGVNDDEITDFVALTREHPWQVRFIERMPMGCGKNFGTYLPSQAVLNRCPELEAVSHDGVAACYRLPDAKGTVGLIAPMSHAFCAECSRIRITADGKLKPCLHSDAEITLRGLSGEELEQAIRRGILMKPERHHMDETGVTETHRGMFAIGG